MGSGNRDWMNKQSGDKLLVMTQNEIERGKRMAAPLAVARGPRAEGDLPAVFASVNTLPK